MHIKLRIPNKLSPQQEALMKAFAEMELDTPGTVNGVTNTKTGNENSSH